MAFDGDDRFTETSWLEGLGTPAPLMSTPCRPCAQPSCGVFCQPMALVGTAEVQRQAQHPRGEDLLCQNSKWRHRSLASSLPPASPPPPPGRVQS